MSDVEYRHLRFDQQIVVDRSDLVEDDAAVLEEVQAYDYLKREVDGHYRRIEESLHVQAGVAKPGYYVQCIEAAKQQIRYLEGKSTRLGVFPIEVPVGVLR